eukprot:CAMPEP_0119157036 /NCGR_PEP_ID=MMETSP1310-20130426/52556_1 /TAXON_ID=464262 /ORGANISM="Genus nov. species nov., Strain RCC2339" /LENGTH=185 /DNA_ID=CAMNT_0007149651 /DNA_START=127 /DNA_END=684 /DNA_ORIENTATION=-
MTVMLCSLLGQAKDVMLYTGPNCTGVAAVWTGDCYFYTSHLVYLYDFYFRPSNDSSPYLEAVSDDTEHPRVLGRFGYGCTTVYMYWAKDTSWPAKSGDSIEVSADSVLFRIWGDPCQAPGTRVNLYDPVHFLELWVHELRVADDSDDNMLDLTCQGLINLTSSQGCNPQIINWGNTAYYSYKVLD